MHDGRYGGRPGRLLEGPEGRAEEGDDVDHPGLEAARGDEEEDAEGDEGVARVRQHDDGLAVLPVREMAREGREEDAGQGGREEGEGVGRGRLRPERGAGGKVNLTAELSSSSISILSIFSRCFIRDCT